MGTRTTTEQNTPMRLVGTLSPAALARVNGIKRQIECHCYESDHKLDVAVSRLLEDLSGRAGSGRRQRANGIGSGNKKARPPVRMGRATQTVAHMVTQTVNHGNHQSSLPELPPETPDTQWVQAELVISAATFLSLSVWHSNVLRRAWIPKSQVKVLRGSGQPKFSRIAMPASLYRRIRTEI